MYKPASFISIAVDSQTLADIESTFKQFHSFLDFLGQNGWVIMGEGYSLIIEQIVIADTDT